MRLTKETTYIFIKRGVYYFSRRVPADLRIHYNRDRIVISLKTKSLLAAQTRAKSLALKLEEDWLTLRWRSSSNPFVGFLRDGASAIAEPTGAPLLSIAMDVYIETKGRDRSSTFEQTTKRSIGYMLQLHGDRPIDAYTRSEVNGFRDSLDARGLNPASVKRIFSTVRAVVNFAAREKGFEEPKAFSGVYLGETATTSQSTRNPIPTEDLQRVQDNCRKLDDEPRWLIALLSDTGLRLSEAVGLVVDDVVLDSDNPHILIRTHPWRRLKTKGSERTVPLVGASLWGVHRAIKAASTEYLFPKYCSKDGCKSNSASAALNKWLAPRVPEKCVVHSFRHSMRDRLRAVECPTDIVDRFGGWSLTGVGESYGNGYPVSVLSSWMTKIV